MDLSGRCFVCGCTETTPCLYMGSDGIGHLCGWANLEQTLCDNPLCLEEALACPVCGILVTQHTPLMEAGCALREGLNEPPMSLKETLESLKETFL